MEQLQPDISPETTQLGLELIPGQYEETLARRNNRFKAEVGIAATMILVETGIALGNHIRGRLHRKSIQAVLDEKPAEQPPTDLETPLA